MVFYTKVIIFWLLYALESASDAALGANALIRERDRSHLLNMNKLNLRGHAGAFDPCFTKHLRDCDECIAEPLCGFCADKGMEKCASVTKSGGNSFGCKFWIFHTSHAQGGSCADPIPVKNSLAAHVPLVKMPSSPSQTVQLPVKLQNLAKVKLDLATKSNISDALKKDTSRVKAWMKDDSVQQLAATESNISDALKKDTPKVNARIKDDLVQQLAQSEREEEIALRSSVPQFNVQNYFAPAAPAEEETNEHHHKQEINQELIRRNALEQQKRVDHILALSDLDRQHKMDVIDHESRTLTHGMDTADPSAVARQEEKMTREITGVPRGKTIYVRPRSDEVYNLFGKASEPKPSPKQLAKMRSDIETYHLQRGYESPEAYMRRFPTTWLKGWKSGAPSHTSGKRKVTLDSELASWHRGASVQYQRMREIIETLQNLKKLHEDNSPQIYSLSQGTAAGVIPDKDGKLRQDHVETYEEHRGLLATELAQIIAYGNHHNPKAMSIIFQEAVLEGKVDTSDRKAVINRLEALSRDEPHSDGKKGIEFTGDAIDAAIDVLQNTRSMPQAYIYRHQKSVGAEPLPGGGRKILEKTGVLMSSDDGSGPGNLHQAFSAEENGIDKALSRVESILSGDRHVAAKPESPFEGPGSRPKAAHDPKFHWDETRRILAIQKKTKASRQKRLNQNPHTVSKLSPSFNHPLERPKETPREAYAKAVAEVVKEKRNQSQNYNYKKHAQ